MSYAILALCGIEAPIAVAACLLEALRQACNQRQPLNRYAVLVTPEDARLVPRIELVDTWHAMDLHGLASKLARFTTSGDKLLLVVVGEDAPKFKTIFLGPVRAAFVAVAATGMGPTRQRG